MPYDLSAFLVRADYTVREVIECIDKNTKGIALLVDDGGRLVATFTDGDIRRAILDGMDLQLPAKDLLRLKPSASPPITAKIGTPDSELLSIMDRHVIRHLPLTDDRGRVLDLALLRDIVKDCELRVDAIVMAGGFGKRLRPLTLDRPKAMVRVGGRPLLELIMEKLQKAGVRRIQVTTHYKSDVISDHFGDGKEFGLEINYIREENPLGTAGALCLLDQSSEPLLVINGDILTNIDYRAMLMFHEDNHADMTVAVREHEMQIPYGVVEIDGVSVNGFLEKPTVRNFINAGVYLLNPPVCGLVPNDGSRFDIPDLVHRLLDEGYKVVGFPVREYWLDIGHMTNYEKAEADLANGAIS